MSQLDIKIRKLQDNGSTFRANIETLYLGGVRSAKVDELRFELPEEWKNCTVTLHVQRLSGTKPDPQILDENNSALVDRRWTLEKEGTWMLLAINASGYIAMTKPGKYTCYDTIDTDTTTENITPSIYEQFVAEVTKYAKQALESMNAAKASEEAAAKSAKEAANSAASMEESVRVSGENAEKAANSAAAAKKSEEAAAKSAEASENSAKKSAESESVSKASAEKAKASEEAAKKSEDAAALSETHAAASEKKAAASETAAQQALQDTETEHTTALQDIARARTTALNDVAASTKTATTAANTATQQANAAAGSASAAATNAREASTSAGEAATSRQVAEKAQKAAEDAAALAGTRAGTDKTLSIENAPADAKATGDALAGKADKSVVQDDEGNVIFYSKAEVEAKIKELLANQRTEDYAKIKFWVSPDPTSPAELFGGTWERIEGRFIMGASDACPAGSTGGSATHAQTKEELYPHSHRMMQSGENAKMSTVSMGRNGSITSNRDEYAAFGDGVQLFTSYSFTIETVGGGRPMDILNPYYSMYIWRRVA